MICEVNVTSPVASLTAAMLASWYRRAIVRGDIVMPVRPGML